MKESESSIQSAICDYLAYRKVFFWRQNTAPRYDTKRQTYYAMPKYARRGVPDIIVIKQGQFIGLEVKRPGTYQSTEQKAFEHDVTNAGGQYAVVRSIEDVKSLGF